MAADEGFEGRRRVHVGDRHHRLDVGDLGDLVPGLFHRLQVRHVRHGTTGVEVGEDHLLVGGGQDVRGFRHEMHAAKHYELRISGSSG